MQIAGFRVQGAGFRAQGSGFRVQGSGRRVQGSGFRVQGREGGKHLGGGGERKDARMSHRGLIRRPEAGFRR